MGSRKYRSENTVYSRAYVQTHTDVFKTEVRIPACKLIKDLSLIYWATRQAVRMSGRA